MCALLDSFISEAEGGPLSIVTIPQFFHSSFLVKLILYPNIVYHRKLQSSAIVAACLRNALQKNFSILDKIHINAIKTVLNMLFLEPQARSNKDNSMNCDFESTSTLFYSFSGFQDSGFHCDSRQWIFHDVTVLKVWVYAYTKLTMPQSLLLLPSVSYCS